MKTERKVNFQERHLSPLRSFPPPKDALLKQGVFSKVRTGRRTKGDSAPSMYSYKTLANAVKDGFRPSSGPSSFSSHYTTTPLISARSFPPLWDHIRG